MEVYPDERYRADSFYDVPPRPKATILFNGRFMAARHEEGCY